MTRLLASVRSLEEARIAAACGVDLIDLKDPEQGALGALALETVREIVADLAGVRPVSATAGDLPMDPRLLVAAASRIAETGVDLVKIGFFAGPDRAACVPPLEPLARRQALVAVLFADEHFDPDLIPRLAGAGFAGVMLDTARKKSGSLTAHLQTESIARFVAAARREGLLVGLAGSLTAADVPRLLSLGPDYLGFRSALCVGGNRLAPVDPARVAHLLGLIRETLFQPVPNSAVAAV